MNSDITEQFLDKLYDDLSKESSRILNEIKTDKNDSKEVYQLSSGACGALLSKSSRSTSVHRPRLIEESRPRLFRPYLRSRTSVYPPNLRAILFFVLLFPCHIDVMCCDAPPGVLLPKTQFALPALQRGGH